MTSGRTTLQWPLGMDQFKPTANLLKILSELYRHDVHPPLYFWALALWRMAFGNSLEVARMFSALFVFATIGLLYRYAIRLRLRWPFVPAVIYAASAAGLRYAYNARPYAMATFLIVLTLYLAERKSKWTGLCAAACVATHYFAGLCVGSIILVECLQQWKSDRRWSVLTVSSFALFCSPLALLVTRHVAARPDQFPGFGNFRKEIDTIVGGALRGSLPGSTLDSFTYLFFAGGLLALVGGIYALRRKFNTVPLAYASFLGAFLLTAVVTNKSIQKMPIDYYLGIGAPFFAVLLWFAIDFIPVIAGPVIALTIVVGSVTATPMMVPRDYRKMMTKIRSECDHCAVVVSEGSGAAVPACTLYEAKGLDVYLLRISDLPDGMIQKIGKNRLIYFVPANESSSMPMEREVVREFAAVPEDDFFKIDLTRVPADKSMPNSRRPQSTE